MREELKKCEGTRTGFRGTFARFGRKRGWKGAFVTTVLLRDVTDARGKKVCDHLWFNLTKEFEALQMQPGELVAFDARSVAYDKGYQGHREDVDPGDVSTDYKLSHPTKVRRVTATDSVQDLPLFQL